jgi:predicted nuclease of predicted toxin-antitoxin system
VPDRPLAFKVDENLPEDVAAAFRDAGYEASTARSQGLAGVEDARLMEVARQEQRVFVTLDVDFGDIRVYPPDEYAGIIVFRMTQQDKTRILGAIRHMLPLLTTEAVTRRLWVVEEHAVRIRGEA